MYFYWIRNMFFSFQTSKVLPLLSAQPVPPGSCFCLWLSPVIPVSNSTSTLRAVKSLQQVPGPRAGPLIQITNCAEQLHSFCHISAIIFTAITPKLTKFFIREFQLYNSPFPREIQQILWNFLSSWIWKGQKILNFPWIKEIYKIVLEKYQIIL